jgi:DegV family protein with EDD domain
MVKIITDTTSCLPQEIADRYSIPVIPQIINFGEESLYEGVDIDHAAFMRRLRTGRQLPKTSAPSPELFVEQFRRLAAPGETIFCIHPSLDVSGTVRSATVAAQEFPDADIRVIDTRTIANPLASIVEQAALWAAAGQTADEIEAGIYDLMSRVRLYFLVATLEYLQRGGRIGGASALLGSVLQIKPILEFRDGKVNPFEKERTHRRAVSRLREIVLEQAPCDGSASLGIVHASAAEEAQLLADSLSKEINQPVVRIHDMPPAIVTHGGPGILGVGFFAPRV